MSTNNAIYHAIQSGADTPDKIAKKAKLSDEETEATLAEWRTRLWVDVDESGKTPKYTLTRLGQADMEARYPDPA